MVVGLLLVYGNYASFLHLLVSFLTPLSSFDSSGEANDTACRPCTPGYYCENQGQSSPTSQCDPGWYCTLGSWLAQPSDPQGGKCVAGK